MFEFEEQFITIAFLHQIFIFLLAILNDVAPSTNTQQVTQVYQSGFLFLHCPFARNLTTPSLQMFNAIPYDLIWPFTSLLSPPVVVVCVITFFCSR